MDKDEFVYSVNGLRAAGSAGKTLYRCWTDVGQKLFSKKKVSFCTLAPVDMEVFFHSRCGFRVVWAGNEATNPTFVAGLMVLACMQDVAYLLEVAFADLISCRPKNACRAIACPAVASDVSLLGVGVVV